MLFTSARSLRTAPSVITAVAVLYCQVVCRCVPSSALRSRPKKRRHRQATCQARTPRSTDAKETRTPRNTDAKKQKYPQAAYRCRQTLHAVMANPPLTFALAALNGLSQFCLLRHRSFHPVQNSTRPSFAARKLLYIASIGRSLCFRAVVHAIRRCLFTNQRNVRRI